jgi:hypothetical protein
MKLVIEQEESHEVSIKYYVEIASMNGLRNIGLILPIWWNKKNKNSSITIAIKVYSIKKERSMGTNLYSPHLPKV